MRYCSCPYVALGHKPRAEGIATLARSLVRIPILHLVQSAQLMFIHLLWCKRWREGQNFTTSQ